MGHRDFALQEIKDVLPHWFQSASLHLLSNEEH